MSIQLILNHNNGGELQLAHARMNECLGRHDEEMRSQESHDGSVFSSVVVRRKYSLIKKSVATSL